MLIALVCLASISGQVGLVLAMIGIELSYILDCVDGQLARVTGRSSEVGGELDFMMDELKAYALIVALGLRGTFLEGNWLGLPSGSSAPLLVSLGALICTASAITLTRFIRSEGFAKATGRAPQKHGQAAGEGRTGGPLWPIKMIARFVTQYPASIPLFAMAGRLDLFLYTYAGFHALYTAQSVLVILIKLGRFAPRSTPQSCSEDEEKR